MYGYYVLDEQNLCNRCCFFINKSLPRIKKEELLVIKSPSTTKLAWNQIALPIS